jgi:hypothetical protein
VEAAGDDQSSLPPGISSSGVRSWQPVRGDERPEMADFALHICR